MREGSRYRHTTPSRKVHTHLTAVRIQIPSRGGCRMPSVANEEPGELLSIEGREVRVSHPDKLYFSRETKLSKLDLVRYYLTVAPGALNGIRDRPIVLKRFVNGAEGEAFYQKRAPAQRPAWLRTITLSFPSGRKAEEIVVDDAAGLAWIINLGCIELHPHPVRSGDLDHPDELRVDLDPGPGVNWADVRTVALEVKSLLEEMRLRGWPKTSGSRGIHINVRIEPRWTFSEVRRAALALSREVERRAPAIASSKWWKEERHGVFLDYNQNAKDRTTCSAYSVRPLPDARVSAPLRMGRGSRLRTGRLYGPDDAEALRGSWRSPCGHRCGRGFARKLAGACGKGRSRGPRRCAMAAALSQNGGRAATSCSVACKVHRGVWRRIQSEEAAHEDAAPRDRQLAQSRRRARLVWSDGRADIPRPGNISRSMMCWSTRCVAGHRHGPVFA